MTAPITPPAAAPDATAQHDAAWIAERERSNVAAIRLMTWISLNFGRTVSRVVLRGVALYFLCFAPRARRASRDYLARVFGRAPRLSEIYAHIFSFAATVHDRIYLLNNEHARFDISYTGEEHLVRAKELGRGGFLLGAHVGSFEVLRAFSRRQPDLQVAMVMYEDNAQKINATLAAINPDAAMEIIPLGRVDAMLQVRDRLDEGAFVGILGDRSLTREAMVPVTLLGGRVELPIGPMRLAAMLRRPVIFMAGLYMGGNRYALHFEPIADFTEVGPAAREAAIAKAIEDYAAAIERACRRAPLNWFNFHEFWISD